MQIEDPSRAELVELIENDGRYLDRQRWDEWLDLFAEDVVFWVPAWKSEEELTDDPGGEVSLIYYEGRKRLQERIWRARSGNSTSSVPMVRTVHAINHVRVEEGERGTATGSANWTVHMFDPRSRIQHSFFGFYEYRFTHSGERWLISRKKIVLLNDYIPKFIDFYTL